MLGRAFKIAHVNGIPLLVHWTFGFFFVWIAFVGYKAGMDQQGILRLCLFAMVLFVCVVLHEFGHALTARRYGIQTKDIIISPIGGVARLFKMPKKPMQELIIALAGPAVNLVIAIILGVLLTIFTERGIFPQGDPTRVFNDPKNFLPALFIVNVLLIVFNLVPAFPMDGGRVFRALLSMRWGRLVATKLAARLGQLLAICFVLYGLWEWDLILVFIGLFVFMSAANEYRSVYFDALLSKATVADLYRNQFTLLDHTNRLQHAIELQKLGRESDFIVVNPAQDVLGVLSGESILDASEKGDLDALVVNYMQSKFQPITLEQTLQSVFALFQKERFHILPVLANGKIVGVVDRTTIQKYVRDEMGFWKKRKDQPIKSAVRAEFPS